MTTTDLHAALDDIEHRDLVADLASRLIYDGMTEAEVIAALGKRINSPIGCELANKYRDLQRGWTTNHYQKHWSRYS
jgi:hypothetical protein